MAPRKEHSLHEKRAGRNITTLIVLIALVGLVGALTIVKVRKTEFREAYDHGFAPRA